MKRLAAWWLSLLLLSVAAQAADKGHDYQPVVPPVPTQNPTRIEVVEMFWYGCPHCYHFEPVINAWAAKRPSNVDFYRVPAIFRDPWELLGRAFYTAEALGVAERLHEALFQAVQVQRRRLDSDDALRTFFAEHGVAPQDFDRTFRSFGVDAKVRRARDLTQRYKIDGVPAVIVNGKYRTDGTMAEGLEKVPAVIDRLVAKESGG